MKDDYSSKQVRYERAHAEQYKAWLEAMPEDERHRMEELGLGGPGLPGHGNGSPDQDAAESPRASCNPDMAALVDQHQKDVAGWMKYTRSMRLEEREKAALSLAVKILRHFMADILAEGNARLTIECFGAAMGLSAYDGDSMTEIGRRYGVTRQAVSKRCVDITRRLNLPPSRAMRSEQAREIYREAQIQKNREE